jgi:hypothetical protein
LNDMVEDHLLSMNESQLESAFQAYCDFYSRLGVKTAYDQYSEGIFTQIILSALIKDQGALAKWRGQHGEKLKDIESILSSKKITSPHVVSKMLHLESHEDSKVTQERRWAVVRTLISDPWLQKVYQDGSSDPMILHLMQHHCLPPDQAEKFDQKITDAWSQEGLASLEIAQFYARQQKPEKAKEFARLAVDQISAENSDLRKTALRVKAAALLRPYKDETFIREMLGDPKVHYSYSSAIRLLAKDLRKEFNLPEIQPVPDGRKEREAKRRGTPEK